MADDQVVEDGNTEQTAGGDRLGGEVQVVRRGGRITRWVVCTRISPLALRGTASRNSSPTRTTLAETFPG